MSFIGSKPVFEGCFHDEEVVDFAQNGRNRPKAGIDSIIVRGSCSEEEEEEEEEKRGKGDSLAILRLVN